MCGGGERGSPSGQTHPGGVGSGRWGGAVCGAGWTVVGCPRRGLGKSACIAKRLEQTQRTPARRETKGDMSLGTRSPQTGV